MTVFSPEDLAVVQGGPSHRRDLLDDALRLLDHKAAATLEEVDRILRQRSALLRQALKARDPSKLTDDCPVCGRRMEPLGS